MNDPFAGLNIFKVVWDIFTHGGFVVLIWAFYKVFMHAYKHEIQHQYAHTIEHTMLKLAIPKENKTPLLAVENIFAQLHAIHSGLTTTNIWIEGKYQMTYHLEIVSFGGNISLLMRIPQKAKDLVMAAVYSQYPECEITEVEDYMQNIKYNPDDPACPIEIFGFEWNMINKDMNPIKTYKDFEDPMSEQKVVDPLQQVWESLAQLKPYEFYGIQMSIQPLADSEWKSKSDEYVNTLLGKHAEHKQTLSTLLLAPLNAFAEFKFSSLLTGGGGHGHDAHGAGEEKNFMTMTEMEKQRIVLVQKKVGKPGYRVKIRHLYISPKDKYDGGKKMLLIGAVRNLTSANSNGIKPDVSTTWTGMDFKVSPTLEKPYLDWVVKERKRNFFRGYKDRDNHVGIGQMIMNTEEIATLYHFPLTSKVEGTTPAPVQRIESKKVAPPANLPIG